MQRHKYALVYSLATNPMCNEKIIPAAFSLPRVENKSFKRNFIKTAVCEFRFPIIGGLRKKNIPDNFILALRKDYPVYKRGFIINPETQEAEPNHSFSSRDQHWTLSLRPMAFGLETNQYRSFKTFMEKIVRLKSTLVPLLDTDFFTRVGLRYINIIPVQREELDEWLNPLVKGVIGEVKLGPVVRAWNEFVGVTDYGKFGLRCGFPDERNQQFVLDTDFYGESEEIERTGTLLSELHDQSFNLFHWCLGKKAIEYLEGG